jgi:sugar/nucleoside kinase (ribokinase family)
MAEQRYDVVGIGNAIVDIIARADDGFLSKHDLAKGFMRLVDADEASRLYAAMGPASSAPVVGRQYHCRARLIWRSVRLHRPRALDQLAASSMISAPQCRLRYAARRERAHRRHSGDAGRRRTMNTFLGASVDFTRRSRSGSSRTPDRLSEAIFDREPAKAAFREASELAKSAGAKVALSLSDAFCVDRHRADFQAFIRDGADIVFANEKEITALYEVNSFEEAADRALADCEIAVLTRSADGSVIVAGGETIRIEPEKVKAVVDVTGAGDLYAAGFLYGYTQGLPLPACGALGSLAAGEIIGHIGARPEISLRDLAKSRRLPARA